MAIQGLDTKHRDDFERLGHPGKWRRSVSCSTGTTVFTGSLFGAGAIIVPTGSAGTVYLSDGGSIPLAALGSNGQIHEMSVEEVNVSSGVVYVMLRNMSVR
jgi:hypothetical protein